MRTLASGDYSATQVEAQLRAGHHLFGTRFDVYDPAGALVGQLDDVVTAAVVEWNADRDYKGSLAVTLFASSLLGLDVYERLVQPVYLLLMPDGGLAEFPLGMYIWHGSPDRQIGGGTPELWSATLYDLAVWLDDGGPGLTGYSIGAGTLVSTAIAEVHALAGTDLFGLSIDPSASTIDSPLTFDITDSTGNLNTWRRILGVLHEQGGYYSPWFDATGAARAMLVPDLSAADPSVTYGTSQTGVTLEPVRTGHDLNRRANRVIARAQTAGGGYSYAVADADVSFPEHPWRHNAIGRYIDVLLEPSSANGLQAAAAAALSQRLTSYQTVQLRSLAWPVHELFDIVAVQWADDTELDGGANYHERRWSLDLIDGEMNHDLRRIA